MRNVVVWLALAGVVAAQPQRIISTAPSITETLFGLGLGERVAGVTIYCRYPPEAARKPKIGTFLEPDPEAILALRPDLVLALKYQSRVIDRLRALKLNVAEVEQDTIPAILGSIDRIAALAGVPDRGAALASGIRARLDELRKRTARLPRRRVLFVVGRIPGTLEGLIAAGRSSFVDSLIEIAGGENIFRDSAAAYPKVSLEDVLARNPEVILDLGDMADPKAAGGELQREVVALWDRYPALAAVKQKRVVAMASDIFVVPGPRVAQAAAELARVLQPEAGF